jgi:hypothetical protein
MVRPYVSSLIILCNGLTLAGVCRGHGFEIHLDNGQIAIEIDPDATLIDLGPLTFVDDLTNVGGGQSFATNGAVGMRDGSGFGAEDTFRFDLVGRLWFSDGGPTVAAPTQQLTVQDETATLAAHLDGKSNGAAGFAISAADSHELSWTITDPSAAPPVPGVFGWSYVVRGADGDGQSYQSSAPVFVALHTEGLTDPATLELAATAVRNAALMPAAGDFDASGVVDIIDYRWWRDRYGSFTGLSADGNRDGTVTAADYVVWRNAHVHSPFPPSPFRSSVPEPAGWLLLSVPVAVGGLVRRRRFAGFWHV